MYFKVNDLVIYSLGMKKKRSREEDDDLELSTTNFLRIYCIFQLVTIALTTTALVLGSEAQKIFFDSESIYSWFISIF